MMSENFLEGKFLSEGTTRFLCDVLVNDNREQCYVPCSCKLSKLIALPRDKKVLLKKNSSLLQNSLTLIAIKHKRNYIAINASAANTLFKNQILKRKAFNFLRGQKIYHSEYSLDSYKCDFFFEKTNTIVELKSIITTKEIAIPFLINSKRALRQLGAIEKYLDENYTAIYIFISFNPYTKYIELDNKNQLCNKVLDCVQKGMKLYGFSCQFKNNELIIKKQIPIKF